MSAKLYVDGFPSSLDDAELTNLFSSFGTVVAVRRPIGPAKDLAEVEMATTKEADKAIHALHGVRVSGKLLLVFAETALPSR